MLFHISIPVYSKNQSAVQCVSPPSSGVVSPARWYREDSACFVRHCECHCDKATVRHGDGCIMSLPLLNSDRNQGPIMRHIRLCRGKSAVRFNLFMSVICLLASTLLCGCAAGLMSMPGAGMLADRFGGDKEPKTQKKKTRRNHQNRNLTMKKTTTLVPVSKHHCCRNT